MYKDELAELWDLLTPEEQAEIIAILPPTFEEWLKDACPEIDITYPHTKYLINILQRAANGELTHIIINMPPQHGKSLIVTRFVTYMLEINPTLQVILGAYSVELVQDFSVSIRDKTKARGKVTVKTDTDAKGHWKTTAGGKIHATSVGGTPTGNTSDLTVIDDPYKNLEDADSDTTRNTVEKIYRTAWQNRSSATGIVIIVHTRWREDDLTGYLLSAGIDNWYHVNLPALAEENDPLGREVGEPLCPALHPLKQLLSFQKSYLDHEWSAIYQGNPTPPGGSFFKIDKIKIIDFLPTKLVNGRDIPLSLRLVRAWDLAATENGGDWTAGVLIGIDEFNRWYILDIVRGQWSSEVVDQVIDSTAFLDGLEVSLRFQQDPGQAGKAENERIIRRLKAKGFVATSERPTGKKEVRARHLRVVINSGDLSLIKGPWNAAFIAELKSAPHGKWDDQWDAASDGMSELADSGATGFIANMQKQVDAATVQVPTSILKCETCGHIQSEDVDPEYGDPCEVCQSFSLTRTTTG